MSDHANVISLEQLSHFAEKSERFRQRMIKEIESLQVELRRVTDWIEHEARDYWSQELRSSQRHFAECQQALVRCMSYVRDDERRPCTEEKKRLSKAQARRSTCEQKLKVVRAAAAAWQRELTKNNSKIGRCRDLAESDLAVAVHYLRGQIEQLETYARLRSPAVQTTRPAAQLPPSGGSSEEATE